jgi:hypothetical protein
LARIGRDVKAKGARLGVEDRDLARLEPDQHLLVVAGGGARGDVGQALNPDLAAGLAVEREELVRIGDEDGGCVH